MQDIDALRKLYNNYAASQNFNNYNPIELYEPLDYILALGGKQMRPVLLLMATQLFDESLVEQALPSAYSVELFHNFSLIHDDIMDAAAVRRGQPTVHQKFGTNTAILSGDVMLVYAYHYLAQTKGAELAELLKIFNQTAIGVCEGQQMDINFETLVSVPLDTYIKMIELKTSILLHGAMKMGALIGAATELDAEYVAEFGRTMGIAFQLQDDYLDSFGDEATFGKRIGGDIVQNKKTFLFLKALELSSEAQREELLHWYNNAVETEREAQKIESVKTIFMASGAVAAIEVEIEKYRQLALTTMEKVTVTNDKKMGLLMFLEYIMQRQH